MKICAIQINSTLDPQVNLSKIQAFIDQAKTKSPGLEAVFLPEVFYSISDGKKPTPFLVEGENEHFQNIRNLAVKNNIYLLGGSAATRENGKVFNRSYNFSPTGELLEFYDKIHLFRINLQEGKATDTKLDERNLYAEGNQLKSVKIGDFHLGLAICFDLRFPELFRKLFAKGVNVFTISSAFTVPTGRAHWKTLVRARAIENQSYVVACNQWGRHNDDLNSYGHSLIVDPWGQVIAECEEGEHVLYADLELSEIETVRGRMDMSQRI